MNSFKLFQFITFSNYFFKISSLKITKELLRQHVQKAKEGHQISFNFLLDVFWPDVYNYQLKRTQNDNDAEKTHAQWALDHCFYETQKALLDLAQNFPNKFVGLLIRITAFPMGQTMKAPSDKLEHKLASLMMKNQSYREKLRRRIFLSGTDNKSRLDKVEAAFQLILDNQSLFKRLKGIGKVSIHNLSAFLDKKIAEGEINETQKEALLKSETARWEAIQVDEFAFEELTDTKEKLHPEPLETVQ